MPDSPLTDIQQRALGVALTLLRTRDRFEHEVRRHLQSKGYEPPDVDQVLQHLIEKRLINEGRTAEGVAAKFSGKRAVGGERLRAELENLGAPSEIVEAQVDALSESETERAVAALRAKYPVTVDRAKGGRFLYSRGFAEESIETALEQFCDPSDKSEGL